jgi:hypothetical protein
MESSIPTITITPAVGEQVLTPSESICRICANIFKEPASTSFKEISYSFQSIQSSALFGCLICRILFYGEWIVERSQRADPPIIESIHDFANLPLHLTFTYNYSLDRDEDGKRQLHFPRLNIRCTKDYRAGDDECWLKGIILRYDGTYLRSADAGA